MKTKIHKSNILLWVKNLCITYGKKKILSDVNFDISAGEIVCLIWPNGAWKSSLIQCLLWTHSSFTWKVTRTGTRLWYVPQKTSFSPYFSLQVKDFFALHTQVIDQLELQNLIKKFTIWQLLETKLSDLSWWEIQKVLLVYALMSNPELLILDEPTAWIDVLWEKTFYSTLLDVAKKWTAVLLVSHDVHAVLACADKILFLHACSCCVEHIHSWSPVHSTWVLWEYLAPFLHTHQQCKH